MAILTIALLITPANATESYIGAGLQNGINFLGGVKLNQNFSKQDLNIEGVYSGANGKYLKSTKKIRGLIKIKHKDNKKFGAGMNFYNFDFSAVSSDLKTINTLLGIEYKIQEQLYIRADYDHNIFYSGSHNGRAASRYVWDSSDYDKITSNKDFGVERNNLLISLIYEF